MEKMAELPGFVEELRRGLRYRRRRSFFAKATKDRGYGGQAALRGHNSKNLTFAEEYIAGKMGYGESDKRKRTQKERNADP